MQIKLAHLSLIVAALSSIVGCADSSSQQNETKNKRELIPAKPNIVILYTDDLGFGDVSAYHSGTLATPNIDKLASQGILFERGYATAATCTPSRYSLLTGDYPLRKKKARVLQGDAPMLITPEQETLPKMLQRAGYTTAVIGKWHLGLGDGKINWNGHITPGANEVGFDYSYIMGATNDRTPNVYVKNGRVVNLDPNDPIEISYHDNFSGEPTGKANPKLLKMKWSVGHQGSINNGVSRIGFQRGGKSAMWIDEDMTDLFLDEAERFVERNQEKPFFLYYAFHQPHVPRLPNQRFVGKSGMGPRGDAILEADWAVGKFMKKLNDLGLTENTIVIFSSDNGHVLDDGYHDDAVEKLSDHTPWGPFRGGKYSLLDAGTHVPFIISWPAKITPKVSQALVSQHDFIASFAALTGQKTPRSDSENQLAAFLGEDNVGKTSLVVQGTQHTVAYHKNGYVYIPTHHGRGYAVSVGNESGHSKQEQLFDLTNDPHQDHNLANKMPKKLAKMKAELATLSSKSYPRPLE